MDHQLERITFQEQVPVELLQTHWSRYVWALRYCVGQSVLDVGCGCGYGTWLLSTVAESVIGIDPSPEAIGDARSTFSDASFLQCSIEDFTGGPFGVIVAFEVVEHCEDVDAVVKKIASLLAPNGTALISLPLYQPSEYHHHRDFGYDQWSEVLEGHFQITGVCYQDNEHPEGNNVCLKAVMYHGQVDWSEASLRFEPDSGNVIFVCRRLS